jgi:hypothetical protein
MGLVRGEDVILSVLQNDGIDDIYVPFACARSVTFDISTDFIETSVTLSGPFKTFIPSGKQYTGNIDGLAFINRPKTNETKATFTFDFTQFVDDFPSDGTDVNIQVQLPDTTYEQLINQQAPFATFNLFINSINNAINTSGTGFTSVISGNLLIITSAPGYGASMNGQLCIYSIETGTNSLIGSSSFSGGVDGYFPDKLGIGWMYDKIVSGEIFQIKYYETDNENNFLYKVCQVYIDSINETSSFDNMVTFTTSFKGNGAPNIFYGEI